MLVQCLLLPHKGQILHILWALYFMKCYPTEEPACAAAGGQRRAGDQKILRKYIWPFIAAIANLETHVVSELFSFFILCLYLTTGTNKIIIITVF